MTLSDETPAGHHDGSDTSESIWAEKWPGNGLTQAQLIEVLKPAKENFRLWGAVYSHRKACVCYMRDALLALLKDPSMTRSRLKRELAAIAKRVEEFGPPDETR